MAIIKNTSLDLINDEKVTPTDVKYILFDEYEDKNEVKGVNKTLNGYNFSLNEILGNIKTVLTGELNGAKLIANLEPNTKLCCKNLDLNTDLYLDTWGVDNPVITLSEKDIKRAKHTVQQYEYLLSIINLMLSGSDKIDPPKYELLP